MGAQVGMRGGFVMFMGRSRGASAAIGVFVAVFGVFVATIRAVGGITQLQKGVLIKVMGVNGALGQVVIQLTTIGGAKGICATV
eukprot:7119824-Ditylum_brightwellii.AAC.1